MKFYLYSQLKAVSLMGCTESSAVDLQTPSTPTRKPQLAYQSQDVFMSPQGREKNNSKQRKSVESSDPNFLLKQRRFQIPREVIIQEYDLVNGDLQLFFKNISQHVSQAYVKLSSTVLEEMNAQNFSTNQSKIYLSEKVLLMSLEVLKIIGEKTNHQYSLDTFKNFNKSQSILLGYLKMKFPRGGQTFVPGDLMKVFKTFDMVEFPENDILRNSQISFTDPKKHEIIRKLKMFFNTIIDELDEKFPIFQNLLQEKIFKIDDKKQLNFKIGRKIPENTQKYLPSDNEQFTINSPQIFRVIIKWVEDMEDFLRSPQEQINEKLSFKTFVELHGKVEFDEINPDDFEGVSSALKQQLKKLDKPYHDQIKALRKQMDMFNKNLLKILDTTELEQKYVPMHEAKVIKYAMFNTKLVSWMLAQKLIFVLKSLIEVGKMTNFDDSLGTLDLVKFNVTDLMRAMVTGRKRQIMQIYENIKKLEQDKELKIIKIKNRLGTPLNDVMIIFLIKESFIICQLQLILSQGQGVSKKLKNIEFLNHFLYELERSPYGVLSQLAVVLGYKDSKINYQDKIFFKNPQKLSFKFCETKHPSNIVILKQQNKPFLCSQCTQFYHPFENVFNLKLCEECNKYLCCKCDFANNQSLEQNQVNRRFHDALSVEIYTEKNKKLLPKDFQILHIFNLFMTEKIYLNKMLRKPFHKIGPKDLNRVFKQKNFTMLDQKDREAIEKNYDQYYILLVQFKGQTTTIKSYKWNVGIKELQNPFNEGDSIFSQSKLCHSQYDFIIFVDISKQQQIKNDDDKKTQKLSLCFQQRQLEQLVNVHQFHGMEVKNYADTSVWLVTSAKTKKTNNIDGIQVEEYRLSSKKDFNYLSIEQARENLPEVLTVQENFIMKNAGILKSHLQYFQKCTFKEQIKYLNLSDNKITNIDFILKNLPNLENLNLSKNFIISITFTAELKNLKKLILFDNLIKEVKNLSKISKVTKINLTKNKLEDLDKIDLENLKQLSLRENCFKSLDWLTQSKFQKLESLDLFQAGFYSQVTNQPTIKIVAKKLKKVIISQNRLYALIIQSDCLEDLICVSCTLSQISVPCYSKLKKLDISHNSFKNMQNLIGRKWESLETLEAYGCTSQTWKFPKMDAEKLQVINVQNCFLEDIEELSKSILPSVQRIDLSYNTFSELPILQLPQLREFVLNGCQLKNITKISNSSFQKLESIFLEGNSSTQNQFPVFNNCLSLESLSFSSFNFIDFQTFANSTISKLKTLKLSSIKANIFPLLRMQMLQNLEIFYCQFQDIQNFQKGQFPSLQILNITSLTRIQGSQKISIQSLSMTKLKTLTLSSLALDLQKILLLMKFLESITIYDCEIKNLPIFKLPTLKTLSISLCSVEKVENLKFFQLPLLQNFTLSSNQTPIEKFIQISFPLLKKLEFTSNSCKDFSELSTSILPEVTTISLYSNQMKELPTLKFPKLENIYIDGNPIQSLQGLSHSQLSNLADFSLYDYKGLKNRKLPILNMPKLRTLYIQNTVLQDIQNLQISNLSSLEDLQLRKNRVKVLPKLKLPKITSLQIGDYDYGYGDQGYEDPENTGTFLISEISNLSYCDFSLLTTLTLNSIKIQEIPVLNFPKLENLYLTSLKELTSLVKVSQSKLPCLKYFNISNAQKVNQLCDLTGFSKLEQVHVDGSPITNIDKLGANNGSRINSIILSNNQISELPKNGLQLLNHLQITINSLKSITPFIYESFNLSNLYLQNNQIEALPEKEFPNLVYFVIANNKLKKLSLEKHFFPKLYYIEASDNLIEAVDLGDLPELETLTLQRNKLKSVNFFNRNRSLPKISNISLSENQIESIGYLPPCYSIGLHSNKITNLDFITEESITKIAYLQLRDNQLTDISKLLGFKDRISPISSLSLKNNKIKKFSKVQTIFSNTYQIDLQNNQLEEIQILQQNFPGLGYASLQHNQLKQLGFSNIINSKQIYQLDVSFNKIQRISHNFYQTLKRVENITLNDNQLSEFTVPENIPSDRTIYSIQLANNLLKKIPGVKSKRVNGIDVNNNPIQDVSEFLQSQLVENFSLTYQTSDKLTKEQKKQIKRKLEEKKNICLYCEDQIEDEAQEQNLQNNDEAEIYGLGLQQENNGEGKDQQIIKDTNDQAKIEEIVQGKEIEVAQVQDI